MSRAPAFRRALLAALFALPAAAQEAPLRSLVGADMVALGAHPAVRVLLRNAARGRQQQVYEGLRLPGPPVALVAEHWLVGWGREGRRGLFIAFDTVQEQLVLFLLVDGQPVYLSPRSSHWPPELAVPFGEFSEGLRPE
ncbi:hypothetical protein [Siccirubricoccus phaeus]|uniref:hypothetical protein n=1 Tax=Siccirubricoccus phaeus TaxID=2595053 RepID=UPI00165AD6C5|nr:hypothetical protein [Siccirubricoccus phaeus]